VQSPSVFARRLLTALWRLVFLPLCVTFPTTHTFLKNGLCHRVRYRPGAQPQPRQRGNRQNTAVSHLATCLFQWLLRRWVLWRMRHNFFWQRLAEEQRFAQPIRGRPRFWTSGFLWQFSVLMPFAWHTNLSRSFSRASLQLSDCGWQLLSSPRELWYILWYSVHSIRSVLTKRVITVTSTDPRFITPSIKVLLRCKNRLMRAGRTDEVNALAKRVLASISQ